MHAAFRRHSTDCLQSYLRRIETCVGKLSDEQVWWRPNAAVNSVGNLLLHLQGNLSQWVLSGMGGARYERHRSQEFAARESVRKAELLDGLRAVVTSAAEVVSRLSDAELQSPRHIQGYDVDGVYVVLHAVEHMGYHTGQIVHVTKELLGPAAEIDFYPQHRGE